MIVLAFVGLIAGVAWKRRRQNAAGVIAGIKAHRGASTRTRATPAIENPAYSFPSQAAPGFPIYDSALAPIYDTTEGVGAPRNHGGAVENSTYAPAGSGDGALLNHGGAMENPTYAPAGPSRTSTLNQNAMYIGAGETVDNAVGTAEPSLPAGWQEARDAVGTSYYYHTDGTTMWTRPDPGAAAVKPAMQAFSIPDEQGSVVLYEQAMVGQMLYEQVEASSAPTTTA